MEQTGFGSDGKYEITEKTLLKDKLKVTKDTGRITAIRKHFPYVHHHLQRDKSKLTTRLTKQPTI